MWYLGGKHRQSKKIVEYIGKVCPNFQVYIEPFCGGMWSGCAVMRAYPDRKYRFNDNNQWLINFWEAGMNGYDPPSVVTLEVYKDYKARKPLNDPATGYIGFAWAFAGTFFGTPARQRAGDVDLKGSYGSTVNKLQTLRAMSGSVKFTCGDYRNVHKPLLKTLFYLDPPYEKRFKQHKDGKVNYNEFYQYAENLANQGATVLVTSFTNERNWMVLHNWGDTVVRHLNGKEPDGTEELLLLVPRTNQPYRS